MIGNGSSARPLEGRHIRAHARRLASRAAPGEEARQRLALAAFGLLVIGAPQLLGGVRPGTVLAILALALASLGTALWASWERAGRPLSALAVVMLAALGLTMLQAVPLPCALARLLSPGAVEHLERSLSLLGAGAPGLCTLSNDPGATRLEVLKGAALMAAFLSASLLSSLRLRRPLLWLVGISVLLMALVALAHAATGLDRVFGLYRPIFAKRRVLLAPIMNMNALGGFLAMGVPLLLGLALSLHGEHRKRRPPLLIATAVLAATSLLSLSRGAAGALMAGVLLFGGALWLRRKSQRDTPDGEASREGGPPTGALIGAASVAAGVGLGTYAASAVVFRELGSTDLGKLELVAEILRRSLDSPLLGVGRGAFGASFSGHFEGPARFVHPENFVAQWATEWGWPMALALTAALARALWLALRARGSEATVGATVALLALGAQNLLDLGLELLGVAVVAAALLGAVTTTPGASRRRRADQRRPPSTRRAALVLLPVSAVLGLLLGPGRLDSSARDQARALRSSLEAGNRAAFRDQLGAALELHPADPELPMLAAAEALKRRDRGAGRWINRAMAVAPSWPSPHLQAAEWLWQLGRRDQALLELREAARLSTASARAHVCRLARADPGVVFRVAPRQREPRQALLRAVAPCLHGATDADALAAADRRLLQELPDLVAPRLRQAKRLEHDGQARAARDLFERVATEHPGDLGAQIALAEHLLSNRAAREALVTCERAIERVAQPQRLVELQARAHAQLGDAEGMRRSAERLRGMAAGDATALARAFAFWGRLEQTQGNTGRALHAFEEANRIKEDAGTLSSVAALAEALGDSRRAARAYRRLCELAPRAAACTKWQQARGRPTLR
ncbi:MAG: hypothetical protein OEZ06_20880 [Myxococcales bacterium]|nr:hypothetical protein [Myxococcales bacterium]